MHRFCVVAGIVMMSLPSLALGAKPTGTVAGRVYRVGGPFGRDTGPIGGITVVLSTANGTRVAHTVSRSNGGAFVLHAAPGSYKFTAYTNDGRECGFEKTLLIVLAKQTTMTRIYCSIR
jgi:hypothetical protein